MFSLSLQLLLLCKSWLVFMALCSRHGSGRMKMGPPLSICCSWGFPVRTSRRTRPRHRWAQRKSPAPQTNTWQWRNTCCKQKRRQHADSLSALCLWIFSIIPVLAGLNVLATQPDNVALTECCTSSVCCLVRVISPRRHASWFPAGPSTHSVVLADELEDRDLVVLRELVFWWVLCHSFIRDTPEKECQRCKM